MVCCALWASTNPRLCNRRFLKGLRLFGFNRLPTTGPVSATLIGCCFSILPPVVLHLRVIPPRPPRLGRRRPPVSAQGRRVRRSQRAPQVHTYQSQSGTRRLPPLPIFTSSTTRFNCTLCQKKSIWVVVINRSSGTRCESMVALGYHEYCDLSAFLPGTRLVVQVQ